MELAQATTLPRVTLTRSVRLNLPFPVFWSGGADFAAWFIESPQSAEPLMDGAPKAGRSFYTSLGHLDSSTFRGAHLDDLV